MGGDFIDHRAGFDDAGPTDDGGDAVSTFPLGIFFASEHRGAAVWPGEGFGAVIGGVHDDGIFVEAELLEFGEDLADMAIVFDHAIGVDAEAGLAFGLFFQVGEDVHSGGVPPEEEGFVGFFGTIEEVEGFGGDLFVDRLHAFFGERAGVVDLAVGETVDHASGAEFFLKLGRVWVIGVFRFFFGVEVVEIAEELIETVGGGEHVVAIAEMIFAELTGEIALGFEDGGDGGIFFFHALWGAWEADFGEAGADGSLASDEGGAACGATLLAIPVGEKGAFFGEAIDVGGFVAHHAEVIGADIKGTDVVAPDDEDIGFLRFCVGEGGEANEAEGEGEELIFGVEFHWRIGISNRVKEE